IFPKLMLDEHFPNSLIARYYGVNVVHSNGDVTYNEVQEDITNPYFIYFPILNCIPFLNKQRFKRVEKLDNLFDEIVEKKRKALTNENTQKQGDLLELMLKACEDPENPKLTDIEFRNNLGVFMLA
ncbi:22115_t:CDS:2, partial [Racocetra persica]